MYIIIVPNVVEGFTCFGPFNLHDDALGWGWNNSKSDLTNTGWQILYLDSPYEAVDEE